MTTHDQALQWAAERTGLPYDRFVTGLTPETIVRFRRAYFRRNGTTIPLPAVLPTVESLEHAVEPVPPTPEASASDRTTGEDPEPRLRAALQANKHTLPLTVSAWKYKRFLEALHVTTKAEKKWLEKIVREEIRSVNEPTAIRLNHFLWWLDGQ